MRSFMKYSIISFLLTFLFIFDVRAECSYQERKDLLNSAKKVDVSFSVDERVEEVERENPNTGSMDVVKITKYYFVFNMIGLPDNLFANITNNVNDENIIVDKENLNNGTYTFVNENTTDVIKYTINFYSINDNCYAEKITTKTINKPRENPIHYFDICSEKILENNKYCRQFTEEKFKENENNILNYLSQIKREYEEKETESEVTIWDEILNTLKEYWYIPSLIIIILLIVLIIVVINKKRGEL